ncbi:glycosyl transferase, partial [Priestia megaterium]
EALASTRLNLLLDVVFNKEVGAEGAVYFNKDKGNLANLVDSADLYNIDTINLMSKKAKQRILSEYSWEKIIHEYETLFLKN